MKEGIVEREARRRGRAQERERLLGPIREEQRPPGERQALLEDQLEALQARIDAEPEDDPVTIALATDLERTIATPGFPQVALPPRASQPAPTSTPAELGALGEGIDALATDAGE